MSSVVYITDKAVHPLMDHKIRDLLCVCFPDQAIFKQQRFYHEMPDHRWFIEEEDRLIAHTALHCKKIEVGNTKVKIGGIAEVAVHPDFRGRGFVRKLLFEAHNWLRDREYRYVMLFGDKNVYSSSGYQSLQSIFHYYNPDTKQWITAPINSAMVAYLTEAKWPEGQINLNGPMF